MGVSTAAGRLQPAGGDPQALAEIAGNGEYWQMYKALGGTYSSIDAIAESLDYIQLGGRGPLTTEEKATLWQMANKSWKPKNNPYSSSVGTKVYNALQSGASAEDVLETLGESSAPTRGMAGSSFPVGALPLAAPGLNDGTFNRRGREKNITGEGSDVFKTEPVVSTDMYSTLSKQMFNLANERRDLLAVDEYYQQINSPVKERYHRELQTMIQEIDRRMDGIESNLNELDARNQPKSTFPIEVLPLAAP